MNVMVPFAFKINEFMNVEKCIFITAKPLSAKNRKGAILDFQEKAKAFYSLLKQGNADRVLLEKDRHRMYYAPFLQKLR